MLFARVKEPTDGVVYHYCSAETLVTIIQSKTMRFSDINLLNDAHEVHWGYSIFLEVATRYKERKVNPKLPKIPESFLARVDQFFHFSGAHIANFIACFSADGDSLSQWRAYANDGRGFAIGYRLTELRKLPVTILEVQYDRNQQIAEMETALAAMYDVCKGSSEDDEFVKSATWLVGTSVALKNPKWRDEKEVRCGHLVQMIIEDKLWRLVDVAGQSYGARVEGRPVGFRVRESIIVPYVDLPLTVSTEHQPIAELVFGPKCQNGAGNLMFLLGNNGFANVQLKKAESAYR